jgi:CRISPR-associated protein Cas1
MAVYLNSLFVTLDDAQVLVEQDTAIVRVDGTKRIQVPLLHLSSIVCLGRAYVSPELMRACGERNISIAFFDPVGRFCARVEGVPGGNVLLRRAQYRVADDDEQTLEISRAMVAGKLSNARRLLLRGARESDDIARQDSLRHGAQKIGQCLYALEDAEEIDELRGLEGAAARYYFEAFPALLKRTEGFEMRGRSRRPPKDRINALLSFGYALLMQDCAAAAAGVGLDPAVGYLHEERPGRLSLALDLMEELRSMMVDRLVVALINRQQVQAGDLNEQEGGGFRLTDAGRRTFLVAWQDSKKDAVRHGFLEQEATWGRVPHLQSLLLARVLRGDLPIYPPFVAR